MIAKFKTKKFAALGIALAALGAMPVAADALSPRAGDSADGVGFAAPLASTEKLSMVPDRYALLGPTQLIKDGIYNLRPVLSEVTGYPADMQLLFTMKIVGSTGARFIASSGDDTTRKLTVTTRSPITQQFDDTTTVTLAPGLTRWSDTTELAFTGTQRAINRAVSLMWVKASTFLGEAKIKFAVTQDEGVAYNVENDHFYRFVDWATPTASTYVADGASRTWTKALADAATVPYKGVTGHLATVTSELENSFVRDRLGDAKNVFLAGSDKDREGQWKWYAGPEAGQVFYEARCAAANTCNGEVAYNDRTPAVNTYTSWAVSATKPDDPNDNEPNDWGAGVANEEDYLVANRFVAGARTQDPRWNDLPVGGNFIGGYVIEYSAPLVNFKGVYVREVPLITEPGAITFNAKRLSRNQVSLEASVRGLPAGSVIEIERKAGNGNFKVVANKPATGLVTGTWKEASGVATFKLKVSDALNVQNTEYRVLVRNLPGLPNREYRSVAATIAPIEIPPFATAVAKLNVSAGQHISNLATSLFSGKGLKPFSKFKIVLRSEPIVLVDEKVGFDGSISAGVKILESIEPGDHSVTITATAANGKKLKAVSTFTLNEDGVVTAVKDGSASSGTLPATGSNSGQLPIVAVMLLMSGFALLSIRKKSRI